MGQRRRRAPRRGIVESDASEIFCCDADSLIEIQRAGLLRDLRKLVQAGRIRIAEGVDRELRRKTDRLGRRLMEWQGKYSLVTELDTRALEYLPDIERNYGPSFLVGSITYGGFWHSASGKKSMDAQVVALAKAQGWTVISNDKSIHGACMLENIPCRRWEEVGRLLMQPQQLSLNLET